jgi:hypothetical protein
MEGDAVGEAGRACGMAVGDTVTTRLVGATVTGSKLGGVEAATATLGKVLGEALGSGTSVGDVLTEFVGTADNVTVGLLLLARIEGDSEALIGDELGTAAARVSSATRTPMVVRF